jgi:hypothetical protein
VGDRPGDGHSRAFLLATEVSPVEQTVGLAGNFVGEETMVFQPENRLTMGELVRLVREHNIDPESTIYIGPVPGQGLGLRLLLRESSGVETNIIGYIDLRTSEFHVM